MTESPSALDFKPPREDPPFEIERIARLAGPTAAIKGLFLDNVLAQTDQPAEVLRSARYKSGKVGAFADVPYLTYLSIVADVATRKRPHQPVGATVRELARGYYARLAETIPGRVIFGVAGNHPMRVLSQGHRGWSISLNFGTYSTTVLGPSHLRYRFEGYPAAMVQASDVGVVLGAMDTLGIRGRVLVAEIDERNAVIDMEW